MIVSGFITKDGLSENKVDTCRVSSMKINADSVLFIKCGKLIHGICAGG